jgi:hypothetical protein
MPHAPLANILRRECVGLELTVLSDSLHRVLTRAISDKRKPLWRIFPSALWHFLFANIASCDYGFHWFQS